MAKSILSREQRAVLLRACQAYPDAIHAESKGERVTLASLYRAGWVTRTVRRSGANATDNAYAYTATPELVDALRARTEVVQRTW